MEQLATAIRLGAYPRGTLLPPERDLAALMGVSRATVREAIAGLRAAGMVTTRRGRGGGTLVVFEPGPPGQAPPELSDRPEDLVDSLVFRRVIEPGACFVAAGRPLTGAQRMQLTTALREVEQASSRGAAEHRQADSRLHLAIGSLTGSSRILAGVTQTQARLHEMLQAIPVLEVNIEHSHSQHRSIVNAILAGKPTQARRAMEHHCDDTAALLRGLLV